MQAGPALPGRRRSEPDGRPAGSPRTACRALREGGLAGAEEAPIIGNVSPLPPQSRSGACARVLATAAVAALSAIPAAVGQARVPDEGRLRGEISFNRQNPVVGANVVGTHEGDPSRLLLGVTDMHGYFRFESIPA
jgi:hypothetical protein